jgi:general secretion pathway protein J
MTARRQRGFTLLELLVALSVFSLVSVMAYSGLRTVLQSKQHTEQRAARIQQLQSAVMLLERDLAQFVDRPVRDEFGDPQQALLSADYGDTRLAFTRAGYRNPTGLPRSNLQRVAYGLEEEALVRLAWPVLDRAQGSEPYRGVLLEGVRELQLRFMDEEREWQGQWPPEGLAPDAPIPLPRAVEVTLELEDLGEVRRLFPLFAPVAAASPAEGSASGDAVSGGEESP